MFDLPDVNVLIALLDKQHIHHSIVVDWFDVRGRKFWATCPMTQAGCVRILSQPKYPNGGYDVELITAKLLDIIQKTNHQFWIDTVDCIQEPLFQWQHFQGYRQMTDIHLLALAVKNKGCLVTLDKKIEIKTVQGAKKENLLILDVGTT